MQRLLWYIPVILAFHNLEEALTMPQWLSVHLPMLREKIWLFNELQFSTKQLFISLLFVTVVPILLTIFCLRGEISKRKMETLLVLQSIVFWNALMPHVIGIFILGMYNPGAVTAIACNIPFTIYLFSRMKKDGAATNAMIRDTVTLGFALYLPLVYLNHLIAQSIAMII